MNITHYNPNKFTPTSFRSLINTFFDDSITDTTFIPKADLVEKNDSFLLHIESPGMNKSDFKIELNDNQLIVSGERTFKSDKQKEDVQFLETHYGTFSRSFILPETIVVDKIKAQYNNGILEITIPKDEKKKLQQVAIEVS